ncbi:ATP-dependent zinc metalloprotease FtsH [Methylomarinum sp. Ch1-1]|uniref:ATP-dependent zinc metalloprotease FtsH n=1 Tax=Methylomarinum roseum TaxID=3067653 RepID=A0AAU7NT46_9GAMM
MTDERRKDKVGRKPTSRQPRPAGWRSLVWLLVILGFYWYWANYTESQQPQSLSYSEFKQKVRAGEIDSVTFHGDSLSGRLRKRETGTAVESTKKSFRFETTIPPIDDPKLISLLEQHQVDVNALSEQADWWKRALIGVLPWILIIGLFWYSSRKMQERMAGSGGGNGIFGFGKSKAKRFRKGESQVSFDDVAGLENAKRDMREITGYLKDPQYYRKLGAKIPKGILLMGPPGTGKTLLAKAVAGEADVPFFSISGSEFIEMFVGVGASRVRDMFDSAKKEAPSIIFIDEIDSVGRARGTGLGGGHDEREQTLNQILGEMDGFDPHEAVVVLAATNRPDVLDPALLRPGRFDRKIILDLPDKKARREILQIHASEAPLADDADLDRLAGLTVGFSGADLENLLNEAALLAGREGKSAVDMAALLNARDKVVLGGKREMVINDEEKKLIAYHEAGHALAASLLVHADPLDKVTIIPRGRALGVTEQIPEEERHNFRQAYLHDRIGVMLGGRVSEQLVFNEVSSGAENDLKQATRLARQMVSQWGMSGKLGAVAFSRGEEHVFLGREMAQPRDFSEHTAQIIDDEIRSLINGIEKEIAELLEKHRKQLEALAEKLFDKETLEADEILSIIEQ